MKKIYILKEEQLKRLIDEKAEQLQQDSNRQLQQEVLNKRSYLFSLQSQMNPHFLYNALEGIRGQAILDDSPVIANVAQALADYFRYSISSRSDIATLREELDNVKNYVHIQKFRFQDRFQVEIEYDPDDFRLQETILPKLTLQPVVENAINHAFVRLKEENRILISIVRTQKSVLITISDNGVGMDYETLSRLNDKISHPVSVSRDEEPPSQGRHNGIAMQNVNQRIKLMFGNDYGLHIASIPDIGTDVEIRLPFCVSLEEDSL